MGTTTTVQKKAVNGEDTTEDKSDSSTPAVEAEEEVTPEVAPEAKQNNSELQMPKAPGNAFFKDTWSRYAKDESVETPDASTGQQGRATIEAEIKVLNERLATLNKKLAELNARSTKLSEEHESAMEKLRNEVLEEASEPDIDKWVESSIGTPLNGADIEKFTFTESDDAKFTLMHQAGRDLTDLNEFPVKDFTRHWYERMMAMQKAAKVMVEAGRREEVEAILKDSPPQVRELILPSKSEKTSETESSEK